jgi:dTDP-4-dehydrorhamnose 3,5-epimerase-like enzyme
LDYDAIELNSIGDADGSLVAIEGGQTIPFEIKRVYYVFHTRSDFVRGGHSHKALEQFVFCPSGSCDFILDDGNVRETIRLDNPVKGIHIRRNIWREFTNFSQDCVVMVLASDHYDESDYIRDYDQFLQSVGK